MRERFLVFLVFLSVISYVESQDLCAQDQHVVGNTCTACPAGERNVAGDNRNFADTVCDDEATSPRQERKRKMRERFLVFLVFLSVISYVESQDLCAQDQHVVGNTCTACPAGERNVAGDNRNFADTVCDVLIPYSDIGDSWTADSTIQYNGFDSEYKDYSGGATCNGRYRVRTSMAATATKTWTDVFNQFGSASNYGSFSTVPNSGLDSGIDADAHVILEYPCFVQLAVYEIRSVTGSMTSAPSKMTVEGSKDLSSWTKVHSFEGENTWSDGELKRFEADESLGPFKYFKFTFQKRSEGPDGNIEIDDINLFFYGGYGQGMSLPGGKSKLAGEKNQGGLLEEGTGTLFLWGKDGTETPLTDAGCSGTGNRCNPTEATALGVVRDFCFGDSWFIWIDEATGEARFGGNMGGGSAGDGGSSATSTSRFPVTVTNTNNKIWKSTHCGNAHAGLLSTDGELWMWGRNSESRAVPADTANPILTPTRVMGGTADGYEVVQVALGKSSSLALTSDNRVFGWGYHGGNTVALDSTNTDTTPGHWVLGVDQEVYELGMTELTVPPGEVVKEIGLSRFNGFMLMESGGLYIWGAEKNEDGNFIGILGKPGTAAAQVPYRSPTKVFDSVKACMLTYESFFVQFEDGSIKAAGNNEHGQLAMNADPSVAANEIFDTWTNIVLPTGLTFEGTMRMPDRNALQGAFWTAIFDEEESFYTTGMDDGCQTAKGATGNTFNLEKITRPALSKCAGITCGATEFCVETALGNGAYCRDIDECGRDEHNCTTGYRCENIEGGMGFNCLPMAVIPPRDVNQGDMWMKDSTTQYASISTLATDYMGLNCPGTFRAKTDTQWNSYHASDPFASNEYPVSSAFDQKNEDVTNTRTFWQTSGSVFSYSNGDDSTPPSIILELPCQIALHSYVLETRKWGSSNEYVEMPAKHILYGTNGCSVSPGTWTELAPHAGLESEWTTFGKSKTFGVYSAEKFNCFKIEILQISSAVDGQASIGDVTLIPTEWCDATGMNCRSERTCNPNAKWTDLPSGAGCLCNATLVGDGFTTCDPAETFPPADIGAGNTWMKDSANQYSSQKTIYKDYFGSTCPGRYRVKTNVPAEGDHQDHFNNNEWPISGAFDRITGGGSNTVNGWRVQSNVAGYQESDANVELILELPCFLSLAWFSVQARNDTGQEFETPSKMEVFGSADFGNMWVSLGSFQSELSWNAEETRHFYSNAFAGNFSSFKFVVKQSSNPTNSLVSLSDIELHAQSWTPGPCEDGRHNCSANANCTNMEGAQSWTCQCPEGFAGDGYWCNPLIQIPPSDVASSMWMKDTMERYEGQYTFYADYHLMSGRICEGKYRVKSNTPWYGDMQTTMIETTEMPPSGAFDTMSSNPDNQIWKTNINLSQYSDSTPSVDLIIETPCFVDVSQVTIKRAADLNMAPISGVIWGSDDNGNKWNWMGDFSGLDVNYWNTQDKVDVRVNGTYSSVKIEFLRVATDNQPLSVDEVYLYTFNQTDEDECYKNTHNCHNMYGTCTNVPNNFTCACNYGYVGDGVTVCQDLTTNRVPQSDIGYGNTWIKDTSWLHNNLVTFYKDYTGMTCPGRYRVMTNERWYNSTGTDSTWNNNEWPPVGAFDGEGDAMVITSSNAYSAWKSEEGRGQGLSSGMDSGLELYLIMPCSISLAWFGVRGMSMDLSVNNPSKLELWASPDFGTNWVALGFYENQMNWPMTSGEPYPGFAVNSSAGNFSYFKVVPQRVSQNDNGNMTITEFEFIPMSIAAGPCEDGRNNCSINATCLNLEGAETWACECNTGFAGEGFTCDPAFFFPPSDPSLIPSGDMWTKSDPDQDNPQFNIFQTAISVSSGNSCPGDYRVTTNTDWSGNQFSTGTYMADEYPPTGAFDGQTGGGNYNNYKTKDAIYNRHNDANPPIDLILEVPCFFNPSEVKLTGPPSDSMAPSKMNIYGSDEQQKVWTLLTSFDNLMATDWTGGQSRSFPITMNGNWTAYKFEVLRTTSDSNDHFAIGDIQVISTTPNELNECGQEIHNCDTSPKCVDTLDSFICECGMVEYGDGTTTNMCSMASIIPDMGPVYNYTQWTKDDTVMYGNYYSMWRNHPGPNCPGIHRVKTNSDWKENAGVNAWGTDEWPPSGAFDWAYAMAGTFGGFQTNSPKSGYPYTSGTDENIELIYELPCEVSLALFVVRARGDGDPDETPSRIHLYGWNATDQTWNPMMSAENEIAWYLNETRKFSVPTADGTWPYYSGFKFVLQRSSSTSNVPISVADIILGAALVRVQIVQLPPSDIGVGDTWTKDQLNMFSGVETIYTDYSGSICPGRYRAKADFNWVNQGSGGTFMTGEQPPSGAFDRSPWSDSASQGFQLNAPTGTGGMSDSNINLILEIPCLMQSLTEFAVHSKSTMALMESPSKMEVYGSLDDGTWEQITSFDGQTMWTDSEVKTFTGDATKGPFSQFKFVLQRYADTATDDGQFSVGEIELFGSGWIDPCANNNCSSDATCTMRGTGFECNCNSGFFGNGEFCNSTAELTQIPASDIGQGDTWTKDESVLHGAEFSLFKDYSGPVCPGRYRALSNLAWLGKTTPPGWGSSEGAPSGVFDRVLHNTGALSSYGYWSTVTGSGMSTAGDATLEVILETPCTMNLASFGVQSSSTAAEAATETPSKISVFGGTDISTPTQLGFYEGVTDWTAAETKYFSTNFMEGPFNFFKFVVQKASSSSDANIGISEIELFALSWQMGEIDECTLGLDNCNSTAANCTDVTGSFTCACIDGFNGDGITCIDADECTLDLHNCHPEAVCTNTDGSFTCAVAPGFTGDGVTSANNVDECTTQIHNCDPNAACSNTAGSFSCACGTGFQGSGLLCSDIDECAASTHSCGSNVCKNTQGSFECACRSGFSGDGTTCTAAAPSCLTADPVLVSVNEVCTATGSDSVSLGSGLTLASALAAADMTSSGNCAGKELISCAPGFACSCVNADTCTSSFSSGARTFTSASTLSAAAPRGTYVSGALSDSSTTAAITFKCQTGYEFTGSDLTATTLTRTASCMTLSGNNYFQLSGPACAAKDTCELTETTSFMPNLAIYSDANWTASALPGDTLSVHYACNTGYRLQNSAASNTSATWTCGSRAGSLSDTDFIFQPASHIYPVCNVRNCTLNTPMSSTPTNVDVLGFSPSSKVLAYGKSTNLKVAPSAGYSFTAEPLAASTLVTVQCGISGTDLQLSVTFPSVSQATCARDNPVLMNAKSKCETTLRTPSAKGANAVTAAGCATLVAADSACADVFVHRFANLPDNDNCKCIDATAPDLLCTQTSTSDFSNVFAVSPDAILGPGIARENPGSEPADGGALASTSAVTYNCSSHSVTLTCTGADDLNSADTSLPLKSNAFYAIPSTRPACPGGTDECTANTDDCDTNAICIDTVTGFSCACKEEDGYFDSNYQTIQTKGRGKSCNIPACGDGIWASTEACEDGNNANGDGCSALCQIEKGWSCDAWGSGTTSNCTRLCAASRGDPLPDGASICDSSGPNAALSSLVQCAEQCSSSSTTVTARIGCPYTMQTYLTAASKTDANLDPSTFASTYACKTVSAPQLRSAAFLTTALKEVELVFDTEIAVHQVPFTTVDMSLSTAAQIAAVTAVSAEGPCSTVSGLFDDTTLTSLGENSVCRWASTRRLIVTLGEEPELPDRLLLPGDAVRMGGGLLQRRDAHADVPPSIYGVKYTGSGSVGMEVEFPSGVDVTSFAPTLSLKGPTEISRCQPLTISGSVTGLGLAGREPMSVAWTLTCTNNAGGASIACGDTLDDAIFDVNDEEELTFSLTAEDLLLVESHLSGLSVTAADLAFSLTVTNTFGTASSAAALTVTFDTSGITPGIRPTSPATGTTVSAAVTEAITLAVAVSTPEAVSGCTLTAAELAISVDWSAQMTSPSSTDVTTILKTADLAPSFNTLKLPPGILPENSATTITAKAYFTDNPGTFKTVVFTVNVGTFTPLTPEVRAIAPPAPSANCPIVISAGASTNPNKDLLADLYSAYFTAGATVFSWTCLHRTINGTAVPPTITDTACTGAAATAVSNANYTLTLPSGALTVGEEYIIGISATASVTHAAMSVTSAATTSAAASRTLYVYPVTDTGSAAAYTVSVVSASKSESSTVIESGQTYTAALVSSQAALTLEIALASPASSSGSCKPSISPVLEVYKLQKDLLSLSNLLAADEESFPVFIDEGAIELQSAGIAMSTTDTPYGAPESDSEIEITYYRAVIPSSVVSELVDEVMILAVDMQSAISTADDYTWHTFNPVAPFDLMKVTGPPSRGAVTVSPASGEAFSTEFALEQSGWASDISTDTLEYKFVLQEVSLDAATSTYSDVTEGDQVLQGYTGGSAAQRLTIVLRAGTVGSSFQIIAMARDTTGSQGEVRSAVFTVSNANPPTIASIKSTIDTKSTSVQSSDTAQLLTFISSATSLVDVSGDDTQTEFTDAEALEMQEFSESALTVLESAVTQMDTQTASASALLQSVTAVKDLAEIGSAAAGRAIKAGGTGLGAQDAEAKMAAQAEIQKRAATVLECAMSAAINSDDEIPASTVTAMLSAAASISTSIVSIGKYGNQQGTVDALGGDTATNTTTSPGKINDGAGRIANIVRLAAVAMSKSQPAGASASEASFGGISISSSPLGLSDMTGGSGSATASSGMSASFPALPISGVSSPTVACPASSAIVVTSVKFDESPRSVLPSSTTSSAASESSDLSLYRCGQSLPVSGLSEKIDIMVPMTRSTGYVNGVYQETGCAFWNDTAAAWSTEGCETGTGSTASMLHCRCSHLTEFGGTSQESTPPATEETKEETPSAGEEVKDIFNDINEEPLSDFNKAANANPENPVIWIISFFIGFYLVLLVLAARHDWKNQHDFMFLSLLYLRNEKIIRRIRQGRPPTFWQALFMWLTCKPCRESCKICAKKFCGSKKKGKKSTMHETETLQDLKVIRSMATKLQEDEGMDKGSALKHVIEKGELRQYVSTHARLRRKQLHVAASRIARKWRAKVAARKGIDVNASSVKLHTIVMPFNAGVQDSRVDQWNALPCLAGVSARTVPEGALGDGRTLSSLLVDILGGMQPRQGDTAAVDASEATCYLTDRAILLQTVDGKPLPKADDGSTEDRWRGLMLPLANMMSPQRDDGEVFDARGTMWTTLLPPKLVTFEVNMAETAAAGGPLKWILDKTGEKEPKGYDWADPATWEYLKQDRSTKPGWARIHRLVVGGVGRVAPQSLKNTVPGTVPAFLDAGAGALSDVEGPLVVVRLALHFGGEQVFPFHNEVVDSLNFLRRKMPKLASASGSAAALKAEEEVLKHTVSPAAANRAWDKWTEYAYVMERLSQTDDTSSHVPGSTIQEQAVNMESPLRDRPLDAPRPTLAMAPPNARSSVDCLEAAEESRTSLTISTDPKQRRAAQDALQALEDLIEEAEVYAEEEEEEDGGLKAGALPARPKDGELFDTESLNDAMNELNINVEASMSLLDSDGLPNQSMEDMENPYSNDRERGQLSEEGASERQGSGEGEGPDDLPAAPDGDEGDSLDGNGDENESVADPDLLDEQLHKGLGDAAMKKTLGLVQGTIVFRSMTSLRGSVATRKSISRSPTNASGGPQRKSTFFSLAQRKSTATRSKRFIDIGTEKERDIVYVIRVTERGLLFEPLCYKIRIDQEDEHEQQDANHSNRGSVEKSAAGGEGWMQWPPERETTVFVAAKDRATLLADAHEQIPEYARKLFAQGVGMTETDFQKQVFGAPQPAFVMPFKFVEQVCVGRVDKKAPEEKIDDDGDHSVRSLTALKHVSADDSSPKKINTLLAPPSKDGSPSGASRASFSSSMILAGDKAFHIICVLSDGMRFRLSCEVCEGLGVSEVLAKEPRGMSSAAAAPREPVALAEKKAGMPEGWSSLRLLTKEDFAELVRKEAKKAIEDETAETLAFGKEERLRFTTWSTWKFAYQVVVRDHPISKTNDNNPSRTRIQRWLLSAISWFTALTITALFFGGTETSGVIGTPFISISFGGGDYAKFEMSIRTLIGMFLSILFSLPVPIFCDQMFKKRTPYMDRHEKMVKNSRVSELEILVQPESPWMMNAAERRQWVKNMRTKEIIGYAVGGGWLTFCFYYLMMFALTSDFRIQDMLDFIIANTSTFVIDYLLIPIIWVVFLLFLLWAILRSSIFDPFVSLLPAAFRFNEEEKDDDGLDPPDEEERLLAQGLTPPDEIEEEA
uniref:EGF-like domain-containing protein n=1 Tax=Chromera velia CCMP2878 TaxID=1169474 RepID=A0A0G4HWB0_9ALVE|eukprot:Cvel_8994.t1-p1 / transcript=Cvel_8994.t1 / gene=Cvel_8994 / organism=Chromera_velia_CCMP2878 / gene_product=Fibrillin-1, putative / transcript_product=Fibrillin-1, putative / location=Cvel_scaffold508:5740-41208(-) / protein_length=6193 / sequence_SO=supercontig / SO=protein_coding / is_pseudo=false